MFQNCASAYLRLEIRDPRLEPAIDAAKLVAAFMLSAVLSGCGSSPSATESLSAEQAVQTEEGAAPAVVLEPLPAEAVQQFERAVVHMNAGDFAAAEQGFRAVADAYPTYSGALVNLGILHARANRLEEAERSFKQAIERNGANAAAFNQLGLVYRKLGRFKEADESYQRAVQIDPNYALAWLNLGVLCDLYLRQPERALEAFERYLGLTTAPDARVSNWVSELKTRLGVAEPRAARTEE